jgi:hypothetical protein
LDVANWVYPMIGLPADTGEYKGAKALYLL